MFWRFLFEPVPFFFLFLLVLSSSRLFLLRCILSPLPSLPFSTGCYKVMRDSLDGILEKCLPLLGDPNMRVQYAAINAIGQMAVDFAPRNPKEYPLSFAARFHSVVIPAFIECMKRADGHPRVQVCIGRRGDARSA